MNQPSWAKEARFPVDDTLFTDVTDATAWAAISPEISTRGPSEVVHCQVEADNQNGATVTDSIKIGVFPATDGVAGAGNYDDAPAQSFIFTPASIAAERTSFTVSGYRRFILKAQPTGAVDDYKTASFITQGQV